MRQCVQYDLHEVQKQAKLKHTILRHTPGSKITKAQLGRNVHRNPNSVISLWEVKVVVTMAKSRAEALL